MTSFYCEFDTEVHGVTYEVSLGKLGLTIRKDGDDDCSIDYDDLYEILKCGA